MRIKSCLSTRRKWQLSSLRMMVAARGASFSRASCPKSSPSCSVVTRPCTHTALHYTSIQFQRGIWVPILRFIINIIILAASKCIYLPMCDHIYRAFPDDVPRSAFVPLTEHYATKKRQSAQTLVINTLSSVWITIIIACFFFTMGFIMYAWLSYSWLDEQSEGWEEEKQTHMMTWLSPLK